MVFLSEGTCLPASDTLSWLVVLYTNPWGATCFTLMNHGGRFIPVIYSLCHRLDSLDTSGILLTSLADCISSISDRYLNQCLFCSDIQIFHILWVNYIKWIVCIEMCYDSAMLKIFKLISHNLLCLFLMHVIYICRLCIFNKIYDF